MDRIVEKEFSPSVEDAITNVVAERSKADEADNKKARELLRACTTRISRVHRSDLSELHRRIFYSIVETSLTNDITDLSIVRGLMLDLTRRGLFVDKNSKTVLSHDANDNDWHWKICLRNRHSDDVGKSVLMGHSCFAHIFKHWLSQEHYWLENAV